MTLWRKLVRHASGQLLQRRNLPPGALLGRRGEEAAYWYLRELGYVMVERNYRPEGLPGEIDLIGWDNDTLVFVEVKTRHADDVLMPEASVDVEKRRHVAAAADRYRSRTRAAAKPFRFDIISIVMPDAAPMNASADAATPAMKLRHFRDAFRA